MRATSVSAHSEMIILDWTGAKPQSDGLPTSTPNRRCTPIIPPQPIRDPAQYQLTSTCSPTSCSSVMKPLSWINVQGHTRSKRGHVTISAWGLRPYLHCCALTTTTSTLNTFPSFLPTFHLQFTMTRKNPLLDQCPNTPPRRRSARRRLSKSPTKLQFQHNTKTQLPPSSPLSETGSESLYGEIGYQFPINIPTLAGSSSFTDAKGKGKEVVSATCLPPTETPSMPSALNHGTRHSVPLNTQGADDQGESSQSSRLSSPPPPTLDSPVRVGQSPSNVQRQVDDKVGEPSQSSRLSTPPPEEPIRPSSPLSPTPNLAPVERTRKRVKGTSIKEPPNLTNNTTAQRSKPKKKMGRSRCPSSSISTISHPDELSGSDIPDIGLPMKDTWENLYANLEDVPEVHVKEETSLEPKAVAHVRKPTKLPQG